MDLINRIAAKRNTTVTVNGTTYPIGPDGVCRGVSDTDAAKLLRNTEAWREYTGKPAAPEARPAQGIALIGADGSVLPRKDEPQAAPEPPPAPPSDEEKWAVPDDDGEWPDPSEEMPIAYLRQMADAYHVTYAAQTPKKSLVKKILSEMYPDKE